MVKKRLTWREVDELLPELNRGELLSLARHFEWEPDESVKTLTLRKNLQAKIEQAMEAQLDEVATWQPTIASSPKPSRRPIQIVHLESKKAESEPLPNWVFWGAIVVVFACSLITGFVALAGATILNLLGG
jgi:hypothetical protein